MARNNDRGTQPFGVPQPGEPIVGIPIDTCRELGAANRVAARHERLADDPTAAEIELQGQQAESLSVSEQCQAVDQAASAHAMTSVTRELLEADVKVGARDAIRTDRDLASYRAKLEKISGRLPLISEGSAVFMWLVLLVIAAGEFVLNRAAFAITGESALNVDVLAITVGVALVAAAHAAGSALRRLFDRLDGAGPAQASLAVASVAGAVALAVVSIGELRAAFFTHEHLGVPTFWLMLLQTFLLWVATALAMAHASPLRAELERREELALDAMNHLGVLKQTWCSLRLRELAAEDACRTVIASAAELLRVGHLHTGRQGLSFAEGAQEASDTPIPASTVLVRNPAPSLEEVCASDPVAASWLVWLGAHPVSSVPPAIVSELDELIGQVVELSLPTVGVDPGDAPRVEGRAATQLWTAEPPALSRNGNGNGATV